MPEGSGSRPTLMRPIVRRWVLCGLLLAVMGLALLAAWVCQRANTERQSHRFRQVADQVSGTLLERMGAYEHGLRGARGAVIAAGPQLSRARFLAYSRSRDYAREFPGVRGFGYIQRVAPGDEAEFVQLAREDGMPGFDTHALVPHQDDRFIILYIEPSASNRAAIGFDIASESMRRQSAILAARTGKATLTPPITLVQQEGLVRQGFLLLLPVYREDAHPTSDDERWEATRGWAYAPLTIDTVLGELGSEAQPYALSISDPGESGQSPPFLSTHGFDALADSPLAAERRLDVHGREWRLQVRARPGYPASMAFAPPWLAGAVTAFFGLLTVALWYMASQSRERRRTAFLDHAKLAALVSGSTDGIIACGADGRITLWNAAAERMLGYAESEALGQPLQALLVDDQERPAIPALTAEASSAPCRVRHKDGSVLDTVVSVSKVRDTSGDTHGLSLFLHDITRHVRAEEQFRRVVEASPSAILMVDHAGMVQLANAKAEELFGYPREALLGQPMDRLLPNDVKQHHAGYIERYFNLPEARPMGAGRDLYGLRRDGTRVPVEIGLNPINMADGRYALAFIIDITERKRQEESIMRLNATLEQQVLERTAQIRTYSSRLGAILEHAGYAIIAIDLEGRITLFNPAAERMLGHAAADMTGGAGIDGLHDDAELWSRSLALSALLDRHVPASFAQIASIATRSGSDIAEWTYVRSDGTHLPVALNVSALRDEQGEASGFLIMASDLTEQKRRDSELHQAISAAEQANRSKSDFLANMSHEIRTPMNAILGMLYLLDKVELPAMAMDMARKINVAARSLLSIINDVLDFSKIEAGRIELEEAPFDLAEVLDNVAALMASAVDIKAVEMLVSPAPEGARYLRGDALRLGQVLVNLVSNAIKFTERGEVALTVHRLAHEDSGVARLHFTVVDTGIGIPAVKRKMIFSPFSQVDSSTTRKYGGTGLGLSICHRLVQLMGGTLVVDSEQDEGSRFHFEVVFPITDVPGTDTAPRNAYHVLVVDDHEVARDNLGLIIKGFGWTAEAADSGERALAMIAHPDAADYDVVLMDWQMPGVDGLTAAADIRRRLRTSRQPIIIMVTAFERKLVDHEAHRASVDAVLTKPVTASVLYNVINEMLARRDPGLAVLRAPVPGSRRLAGYRLLVVDDSEINLEVAHRILEGEGALVEQASDGREALARLHADADRFDAVLMDVQMPEMDGYEATRRIRASSALAGLPVIALTAGAFKPQQDAALDAGMTAFVAKPFEVDDLIATIVRCAPGRYGMQPDGEVTVGPTTLVGSAPEGLDPQLLDVEKGLAYWRDETPYKRYLLQFSRRYGGAADALQASLERHDTMQACSDIHRMRGAAASLALPGLVAISAQIEEQLRQGSGVADLLPSLRLTLKETLEDVAQYVSHGGNAGDMAPAGPDVDPVASLQDLLRNLDGDDPQAIEASLACLSVRLPPLERERLTLLVEEFDYRAAEQHARVLLEAWQRGDIPPNMPEE
jgi:PAS domain S-box-containing protein